MREIRKFFLKEVPQEDRFRTGDRPTQEIFAKLFDSIGFIRERSDRAKINEQGFVRLVDDEDAKAFEIPQGGEGFSFAVQPTQLPEVAAAPEENQFAPDQPPFAVDVRKDVNVNPRRAVFLVRLRNDFVQWLVERLLPSGGFAGQVLVKTSSEDFAADWRNIQTDRASIKNIDGTGVDLAYNQDGYDEYSDLIEGGRRGVVYLNSSQFNTWFLRGNPDPRPLPADGNNFAIFRQITVVGSLPGFRLKLVFDDLQNEDASLTPTVKIQDTSLFSGNINLNGFGTDEGGITELDVVENDVLTFVKSTNGAEWVLVDYSSPANTENAVVPVQNNVNALFDIRQTVVQQDNNGLTIPSVFEGVQEDFMTRAFRLGEGTGQERDWLATQVTVPENAGDLKVKIDFKGDVTQFLNNSISRITLLIDGEEVDVALAILDGLSSKHVTFSWVGDKDNNPLIAGQTYDIRVNARLTAPSTNVFYGFGALTIS